LDGEGIIRMFHSILRDSVLCLAILSVSACRHGRPLAPQTWRFDVSSFPDRVVPPVETPAAGGMYRVPVEGLTYAHPECHAEAAEFSLVNSGKGLSLQFPSSVLESEGHDPADAWDVFRDAVLRLEDNGCLPRESIQKLSTQLVGAIPFTTRTAYAIRYSNYERTGAINLEPGFRLKVLAPILKPGFQEVKVLHAPRATGGPLEMTVEGLEGYETAYYAVQPREGGGVQFSLSSVEQNRMNVVTHTSEAKAFELRPAPGARFFRLMFLRRASVADRDISLLGAPEWGLLLDSAHRFDTVAGTVDDCGKVPGLTCVAVSKQVAILSEIGIEANGQTVFLPVGGTLRDLLGTAGKDPGRVVALMGVKVERPWHGRMFPVELDRGNLRSFSFVLMAGDRVTWP
jgi:hypothetical protein